MDSAVSDFRIFPGEWITRLEGFALEEAVTSWEASPAAQKDPFKNRQILALMTLQMVQAFRAEEERLFLTQAPDLSKRRDENHLLALRLRGLMSKAEQGLDVVAGIRSILGAWTRQQGHPAKWGPRVVFDH